MSAAFFLLLAVVVAGVGCAVVYLRHRTPRSVESGIRSFQREMDVLANRPGPDPESRGDGADPPGGVGRPWVGKR